MGSGTEEWKRLQELFDLLEATPVDERERVLREQCPDEGLRARAWAIFEGSMADAAADGARGVPVRKIGPYTLIKRVGAGGIGAVYLVERMLGGAVQRSALKVLGPHAAGPEFVERFEREQHILASLEHPNITRMLDAGLTETGEPYLVMEYVDGVHLDTYCDAQKLGVTERVELFLKVCDAVAYAHRNLVVHLDLKPSNILVTADGTVKLLDFGTSKLIQMDGGSTATVMATPAYASPEQLRNEAVTTACHVYALGAVLFELLAGRRPGDKASVAAMLERAMREQEVERLTGAVTAEAAAARGVSESRLRQMLSGDLATIVAKCLSVRPRDRYASVDALSGDLHRYLDGRPILARPQTVAYKVSKFVRRNRGLVAASVVVVLALLSSLGYAEWRQRQALREGQRALRMQTFMYRLFTLANSNYMGKPAATVPEFLVLGVKLLPEYIKDPADLREAQMGLAESMYNNDSLDDAQPVFTQIIASAKAAGDYGAEAEAEAFAGDIEYEHGHNAAGAELTAHALQLAQKHKVSPSVLAWAEIYYAVNREKNGFRSDENLKLLQAAVQAGRNHQLPEREAAYAIYQLAEDDEKWSRLDEAEQLIKEDIQIYASESYALCDQAQMYEDLGLIQQSRGDLKGSLPLYQKAYDGLVVCSGQGSKNTLMVEDILAGDMERLGQAQQAVPMLESSLPLWSKITTSGPDLYVPMYYLARGYVETGRYAEGEAKARSLLALLNGKVNPKDHKLGSTELVLAEALVGEKKYREALPHAEFADDQLSDAVAAITKKLKAEAHGVVVEIQGHLGK